MANQWFRLYAEWEDDPKVQMMPEHMQRRLAMLFCSRCKEEKLTDQEKAFKWRISPAEVQETKAMFLAQGFIDEGWNLINWNKRQFLSDSSTDRVRKHRANSTVKHDETLHGTVVPVTVTPPEQIQTQKQTQKVSDANASSPLPVVGGSKVDPSEAIYDEYPRKEGKRVAIKAIDKAAERLAKGEMERKPMTRREAYVVLFRRTQCYARSPAGSRADKTLIPHPATWFNQSRYLDDDTNWNIDGAPNVRTNANFQVLQASIAARRDRGIPDGDGDDAGGEAGQSDTFALLRAAATRAG